MLMPMVMLMVMLILMLDLITDTDTSIIIGDRSLRLLPLIASLCLCLDSNHKITVLHSPAQSKPLIMIMTGSVT